jgi:hypothetical protein
MALFKARRLFAAAIALVMCLGTVSSVGALPAVSFTKFWFSDENFQNWVGEDTLLCSGQRIRDGVLSGYSLTVVTEQCGTTLFFRQCYADQNHDRILEVVGCPW